MGIDWVTLIAQILNFLVLVWLLGHFLYHPIVNAMNEREKKIADRLNDAQKREDEAKKDQEEYQKKVQEFEQKSDELLKQAKQEADNHRTQLEEDARKAVDAERARWEDALKREKETYLEDLRVQTVDILREVARRALHDLADADLEQKTINTFITHIKSLSDDEKSKLSSLLRYSGHELQVNSAFDMPDERKREITDLIHKTIEPNAGVTFNTVPSLISGVEIRAPGYKLSWSIDTYLESLIHKVSEELGKTRVDKYVKT